MAGKKGRRNFGRVRKLPSKRYQASYVGPDMKRHNGPQTFDTREDAEGWLSAQRRLITGDEWTAPELRTHTAHLGEYAEAWLATRTTPIGQPLKPKTRQHYRQLLDKYILPTFGDGYLRDVTPARVRGWYAAIKAPVARAHAYALLRSIMATAVADGDIAENPCQIQGGSKARRSKEIRPATLDQLAAITEAMPERLRLLIQLSAWCAFRFGEAVELRRRDIEEGLIRIRRGVVRVDGERVVGTPKSEAGIRDVNMPPHLLPIVEDHLERFAQPGPDGLLFAGKDGRQLAHSSLDWHFRRARAAAGRPDLTFHGLRHTGAVLAAQTGAPVAELMARLGHSTPEMAMRYQHASQEQDRKLAVKLSKLANGQG